MKFCVITPVGGLKKYATRSKIHLVLPQIKLKAYRDFYVERRKAGDTIILDNGAYEGANVTDTQLVQAINLYRPQIIVCPDVVLQPCRLTIEATRKFLDKFYHQTDFPCAFMCVPQAPPHDLTQWWNCCKTLLDDPRITWLGIPRNLYTHYGKIYDLRATVAMIANDLRPDINIHALGMAEGMLTDLRALAATDCVWSVDSSAPVWRGHNGYLLDNLAWAKRGTDCDFKVNKLQHPNLIEDNLQMVFSICRP